MEYVSSSCVDKFVESMRAAEKYLKSPLIKLVIYHSSLTVHDSLMWLCGCVAVTFFIFLFFVSYREKAMQDAAAVSKHVEGLLQSVGKVCCKPMNSVNKCLG